MGKVYFDTRQETNYIVLTSVSKSFITCPVNPSLPSKVSFFVDIRPMCSLRI